MKEFIIGENLSENTSKLLTVDYSIVEDVLEIGIPTGKKPPKDKVKTLIGDPLEVFTNALFTTLAHIKNADISIENIEFRFSQAEIVCMYSDIEDDEEFCLRLLKKEKVLLVPGKGFNWNEPDHFRIVYLPRVEELADLGNKIERVLSYYKR